MVDIRIKTFTVISNPVDGTILSKYISGRIETESTVESNDNYSLLENVKPFPLIGEQCTANELYNDATGNWNCIQSHIRTEHAPIDVPALFRLFKEQGLPWVQPIDQYDAYNIGDWCTFEGQSWMSNIDVNVWSPTGYPQGWDLMEDEI